MDGPGGGEGSEHRGHLARPAFIGHEAPMPGSKHEADLRRGMAHLFQPGPERRSTLVGLGLPRIRMTV